MRGKRTDDETIAKVIEAKINTNAQGTDIAEELWIPERTVNHIINTKFAEVCEESIWVADLVTRNNNLQSSADALIAEMIASKDDSITIAQLTSLRESTFKQNQLISGKSTENVNFIGDLLSEIQWIDTTYSK